MASLMLTTSFQAVKAITLPTTSPVAHMVKAMIAAMHT
jgi:hypothetical protein